MARTGAASLVFPASLRAWRPDASGFVWGSAAAVLIVLVIVPLAYLVGFSLGLPRAFTVRHYAAAFTDPKLLGPIRDTFILGGAVGLLSVLLGAPMAWAVTRTDMPGRGLVRTLAIASFVTPPFLGAMAWIILAGPNAGLLNQAYRALTGATEPLLNIFSLPGLIAVMSLYTYPFVFIITANALATISAELEDAASIAGASPWHTGIGITLPLALPAILGGFILAVLEAMVLFGSPAMIAIPARFHVMTTQLWALFQYPPKLELAAAYSLPLLFVAIALLWAQRRLLGRKGYATLTGKATQVRVQRLGGWRYPVLAACLLILLFAVGLPFWTLISASLSKAWGRGLSLDNLTLDNFHRILFAHRPTREAIINTLQIAIVTATVGAAVSALVAYVSERRLVRGHRALAFLATAPIAIPGIVLSIGLFAAYTRPPFILYGTIWILFISYLTKYLPIAYPANRAAVLGVHVDLEDAARILGASRLRAFIDVTRPLFKTGLLAAFLLVFLPSLRELSSSILLYTAKSRVVAVVIYELYEEGLWEMVSAMGILLLGLTLLIVGLAYRFLGRRFLSL